MNAASKALYLHALNRVNLEKVIQHLGAGVLGDSTTPGVYHLSAPRTEAKSKDAHSRETLAIKAKVFYVNKLHMKSRGTCLLAAMPAPMARTSARD